MVAYDVGCPWFFAESVTLHLNSVPLNVDIASFDIDDASIYALDANSDLDGFEYRFQIPYETPLGTENLIEVEWTGGGFSPYIINTLQIGTGGITTDPEEYIRSGSGTKYSSGFSFNNYFYTYSQPYIYQWTPLFYTYSQPYYLYSNISENWQSFYQRPIDLGETIFQPLPSLYNSDIYRWNSYGFNSLATNHTYTPLPSIFPHWPYSEAHYLPWIEATDPISKGNNLAISLPPSGYVAGIYAQTNSNRGVWKAPAGIEIGITGALEYPYIAGFQSGLLGTGPEFMRGFLDTGGGFWATGSVYGGFLGSNCPWCPYTQLIPE